MESLGEKIRQIEIIHDEYVSELEKLEYEQKQAIHDFLETVKNDKISRLRKELSCMDTA